MRNKFKIIAVLVFGINLTGCESMNGSYDCPLTGSASCESLHDMDNRINNGEYFIDGKNPLLKSSRINEVNKINKDSIAKIWVAPYEDSSGDYHEPSYVYTVV